jgi:hypothetical protein
MKPNKTPLQKYFLWGLHRLLTPTPNIFHKFKATSSFRRFQESFQRNTTSRLDFNMDYSIASVFFNEFP